MKMKLAPGDHVIFSDSFGNDHAALVTSTFSRGDDAEPGCNLVYVSADESRSDQYGRQIERSTSAVHKSSQPAYGMYWRWPDEEKTPVT
jgi:hypothetical protein